MIIKDQLANIQQLPPTDGTEIWRKSWANTPHLQHQQLLLPKSLPLQWVQKYRFYLTNCRTDVMNQSGQTGSSLFNPRHRCRGEAGREERKAGEWDKADARVDINESTRVRRKRHLQRLNLKVHIETLTRRTESPVSLSRPSRLVSSMFYSWVFWLVISYAALRLHGLDNRAEGEKQDYSKCK